MVASIPLLRQHGVSISEAIKFALRHLKPEGRTKGIREVVAELVASEEQRFERGDLRDRSYWDFRERAEKLANSFEGRIASEISAQELKAWIASLKLGSRSNKNYLSVAGEVFKLATQRRYIGFSPLDELTDNIANQQQVNNATLAHAEKKADPVNEPLEEANHEALDTSTTEAVERRDPPLEAVGEIDRAKDQREKKAKRPERT
jgi:hypothetical protein